jgi:hypothetical protein
MIAFESGEMFQPSYIPPEDSLSDSQNRAFLLGSAMTLAKTFVHYNDEISLFQVYPIPDTDLFFALDGQNRLLAILYMIYMKQVLEMELRVKYQRYVKSHIIISISADST